MAIAKLRELLVHEPSKSLWQEICSCFEPWDGEEPISTGLTYANEHMASWPDQVRHMEKFRSSKKLPPYWSLVRSIRTETKKDKLPVVFGKKDFSHITRLRLEGCYYLEDIGRLEFLPNLISLNLNHCWRVTDGSILTTLPKLRELDLYGCSGIENIEEVLTSLLDLERLDIGGFDRFQDTDIFGSLKELRYLRLSNHKIKNVSALAELPNLENLDILPCYEVEVKPHPFPYEMKNREEVETYQAKIREHYGKA